MYAPYLVQFHNCLTNCYFCFITIKLAGAPKAAHTLSNMGRQQTGIINTAQQAAMMQISPQLKVKIISIIEQAIQHTTNIFNNYLYNYCKKKKQNQWQLKLDPESCGAIFSMRFNKRIARTNLRYFLQLEMINCIYDYWIQLKQSTMSALYDELPKTTCMESVHLKCWLVEIGWPVVNVGCDTFHFYTNDSDNLQLITSVDAFFTTC